MCLRYSACMAYIDFNLKELPREEMPRERLLMNGPSSLSNTELISIILGKGVKGEPVNILAQKLLAQFNGISEMRKASIGEVLSVKGIGLAKACQLLACFELGRRLSGVPIIKSKEYLDSDSVYKLVKPYLIDKDKEHFLIVALDARKRLIAVDNISIGTINQSLVHPREVFKTAINRRASFIVIAHNHPSGDSNPSADDISVTDRLVKASYTIGIPIIDHIIVGDNAYSSLKDDEYINIIADRP